MSNDDHHGGAIRGAHFLITLGMLAMLGGLVFGVFGKGSDEARMGFALILAGTAFLVSGSMLSVADAIRERRS